MAERLPDLATQIVHRDPQLPLQNDERKLLSRLLGEPGALPQPFWESLLDRILTDGVSRLPIGQLQGYRTINTYTPSWTAATSNPSLGNGTLTGRYARIGKHIVLRIGLAAGSTTTFGTGAWRFSLPVTPEDLSYLGSAWAIDSSVPASYGIFVRAPESGQTYLTLMTTANPAALVDASTPFAWANTDILRISVTYEAA